MDKKLCALLLSFFFEQLTQEDQKPAEAYDPLEALIDSRSEAGSEDTTEWIVLYKLLLSLSPDLKLKASELLTAMLQQQ